ncbi:MAG: CDP-diacylglycerol--serine O-phosphatidyltransferase, partial [Acidobacteria bacterium]
MRPLRRHGLPRRRRIARLRRGVYLMPSLLTTTNIFCGFASIVLSFHQDF